MVVGHLLRLEVFWDNSASVSVTYTLLYAVQYVFNIHVLYTACSKF